MKINSENLWNYVNNLATNERVKFDVYYDDEYLTQILWNGDNFEWESGLFTSEAFFNPLYDFKEVEEEKEIPEKLKWKPKESMAGVLSQKEQIEVIARRTEKLKKEFNNLIDYLKSKGE